MTIFCILVVLNNVFLSDLMEYDTTLVHIRIYDCIVIILSTTKYEQNGIFCHRETKLMLKIFY
jgi:hypothetical protein